MSGPASNTPKKRDPLQHTRRWVVVARRPRAAAHFLGPFTLDRAFAESQRQGMKWEDAAVGVYELNRVVG